MKCLLHSGFNLACRESIVKRMPGKPSPKRDADQTRARILRAACREFMRHGYSGARIEELPFPDDLRGKYQDFTQADLTALLEKKALGHVITMNRDGSLD